MRTPANVIRCLSAALTVIAAVVLGTTTASASASASAFASADLYSAPGGTTYAVPAVDAVAGVDAADAIPSCALSSLPSQASDTLALIHSGGPFPYDQDGTVFQNREGILPTESTGYYHEYTVKTPGSPDRGARRLIGGGPTTTPAHLYYTDDHYASFCEVDEKA